MGLILSPWTGGFFLTITFILFVELAYGLMWSWQAWRLLVALASLSGWFLGKTFVAPYFQAQGWKAWVDSKLCKVPLVNLVIKETESKAVAENNHAINPVDSINILAKAKLVDSTNYIQVNTTPILIS